MLTSKFVKFFRAILKRGVDSSPNFVSLFQFYQRLLLCTFLAQAIYTLLIKNPLNWKSLGLSSAQVKIFQIRYSNFERTSQSLFNFCILRHFNERLLLCTISAQAIYTLLKRSPLKRKYLRLSSGRVKFCQIFYANFEKASRFCPIFCIPLQLHGI